jgi:hypothetical protein
MGYLKRGNYHAAKTPELPFSAIAFTLGNGAGSSYQPRF